MSATVGSALRWWALTKPDDSALVVGEERLTYRQLDHWSSRVARRLAESGITPGDRVGLSATNCLAWPVAAHGVLKCGAVLVPLNPRFKAAEIRRTAEDAEFSAVIVAADQRRAVDQASAGGSSFEVIGLEAVQELRTGPADDFRIDRDPEEAVALIFTSGSTGMSKGVILTSRTLLNIVLENTLTEEGFRPGSTSLLVLPLAFTPGLVYGLMITTVLGGTLIVEPDLNPSRAVELIQKYAVNALFGVPLIFQAIASAPEFDDADLRSLATAIVGGASVSVPLLRRWADKGVLLRQIYGMTEAGGVATATLRAEALDHPDTCGNGSIFTEVKVMRPDGSVAAPGEVGELVVRGPGVTPGYWQDPETTAAAIRGGWLHSGDLGTADEQGRIAFVDRLKDLIISGGINISPIELEAVIGSLDGVTEVAVIAAPDARFGETPAAIVSTVPGSELTEVDVVRHCEQVLADYKVPRYVILRTAPLPRLPAGKVDKPAIRAEYVDVTQRFARAR